MMRGMKNDEKALDYITWYRTPQGFDDLLIRSDGKALTGLWFEGSTDEARHCGDFVARDLPIFRETAGWLDSYFAGRPPAKLPCYRIDGLTPFRKMVIEEMLKIPFGKTITYGDIATRIAKRCGRDKMSAQAVGGAVGWNPLCVMIPCHRVVGHGGALVGYGGGLSNKSALLAHETEFVTVKAAHETILRPKFHRTRTAEFWV